MLTSDLPLDDQPFHNEGFENQRLDDPLLENQQPHAKPIIDSHVHFWDPSVLRYPWLDEIPLLNRAYLPDDYRAATAGIDVTGIVFVQAGGLPEQTLDEVAWVQTLADGGAPIKAIVAHADLEQGDAARPMLEKLAARDRVRGVRRLIQSEALEFATQPGFVRGVQALAEYDFSFDICVLHHQLGAVIELVRQCPQVRLVLDHGGKPGIKAGLTDPWRDDIRTLASFDNVCCKLSGLVTEADMENWTPDQLRPYLDHLIEAFGADRLMFGSDYPVVNRAGGYGRWLATLKPVLDRLSAAEQRAIYAGTAARFYGIDLT